MGALKIVFRRIGGKIIPIKIASKVMQTEYVTVREVQKARAAIKTTGADIMFGTYLRAAQKRSKIVGETIAKRISRFRAKGIKF